MKLWVCLMTSAWNWHFIFFLPRHIILVYIYIQYGQRTTFTFLPHTLKVKDINSQPYHKSKYRKLSPFYTRNISAIFSITSWIKHLVLYERQWCFHFLNHVINHKRQWHYHLPITRDNGAIISTTMSLIKNTAQEIMTLSSTYY